MLSLIYSCGCKCTIHREMTIICCIKPCQTYWITMRHFDLAEDHGIHLYGILVPERSRSLQTTKIPLSFPMNILNAQRAFVWFGFDGHWEEVYIFVNSINYKEPSRKVIFVCGNVLEQKYSRAGQLSSYHLLSHVPKSSYSQSLAPWALRLPTSKRLISAAQKYARTNFCKLMHWNRHHNIANIYLRQRHVLGMCGGGIPAIVPPLRL